MCDHRAPTQQELTDRFRPRNLRRDASGAVIMYEQVVGADGRAGPSDPVVRWQVLSRRLCGLCGDRLGEEVAFLGRPDEVSRGRFSTPGLHVDCARFAVCAIPFYADGVPARNPRGSERAAEFVLAVYSDYMLSRFGLALMRGVPERRRDTIALIRVGSPSRTERHTGWQTMATMIAESGGCPTHAEQTASGCREHAGLLSPGERARIAERLTQRDRASKAAGGTDRCPAGAGASAITNMRELFTPRNLRIEANGFPLTYDNAVQPDGNAEGPTDMRIERRLLRTKRCLVCGDDLGSEVAFIGTTLAAAAGWYPTPGMHVDCARFSFAVCPYMSRPDWRPQTHTMQHIRTAELVLVIADSYRYSPLRWWRAWKLQGPFKRGNQGSARPGRIISQERYPGRREMLAYLNDQGGCPAHREQDLTGALAHQTASAGVDVGGERAL